MASIPPAPYKPDVAVPPGRTIMEIIHEKGMSQVELAQRLHRPPNKVNQILHGNRAITAKAAIALERVLGLPAEFWIQLETNYQLTKARLASIPDMESQEALAERFPVKEMTKRGWISKTSSMLEKSRQLLQFFGVASLSQIPCLATLKPAFRISPAWEASPHAVAAWLRMGELRAAKIKTCPFDAKAIRKNIGSLRSLSTRKDDFSQEIVDQCARCGVAVVVVPHLPKSYINGAAYWIAGKAVVQLSLRYRTNDHFWFDFFHELGHILLHGKRAVFLDDFKDRTSPNEVEANEFASNILIPPAEFEQLRKLNYRNAQSVSSFAHRIGIASGIAVGRLQHDDMIGHHELNYLRRQILWPLVD